MKKILAGMIALMLITGNTSFAAGDKKAAKKKETKTECKASDCKDKKDCKDKTDCPKTCKPSCGK